MSYEVMRETKPFQIEAPIDIRAVLIKNAIYWVLGRNKVYNNSDGKKRRIILYSILSRLVLLFQRPIAVIIFDENNKVVFKSLDNGDVKFGDLQLSKVFCEKIKNISLDGCYFNFFRTNYKITFIVIEYDREHGNIENAEFKPVKRMGQAGEEKDIKKIYEWKYGQAIRLILDDLILDESDDGEEVDSQRLMELIDISQVSSNLDRNINAGLRERFENEFKVFPWGDEYEKFTPKQAILSDLDMDDIEIIDELLKKIKHKIINRIYNDISGVPLVSENKSHFNNVLFFIKTATAERIGYNSKNKKNEDYKFSYALRMLLADAQKDGIKEYYEGIVDGSRSCSWYDCEKKECRIKGSDQNNIGSCIFKSVSPMGVDDFINNLEAPFTDERSFIDTPLCSGILGVADIYPDFSRSRLSDNASVDRFDPWSRAVNLSARHACTLCLTVQKSPFSDKTHPKAIVAPIMTNGTCNMAVVYMSSETTGRDSERHWMAVYSTYLAVISRLITQRVRVEMKELFLSEITLAFREELEACLELLENGQGQLKIKRLVQDITFRARCLSHIFPFPSYKFSLKSNGSDPHVEIFEEKIFFRAEDNGRFEKLFMYEFIGVDDIKKSIVDGYREVLNSLKDQYGLKRGAASHE